LKIRFALPQNLNLLMTAQQEEVKNIFDSIVKVFSSTMLHDDSGLHQVMFFSHLRQICNGQSKPASRLGTPGLDLNQSQPPPPSLGHLLQSDYMQDNTAPSEFTGLDEAFDLDALLAEARCWFNGDMHHYLGESTIF